MKATDVRCVTAKTGNAMLLAVTGSVLLGAAMLVAFVLRPPLLGWVGFAVACAIVIALASFAAVVSPRLRVSAQPPVSALDDEKRLLVVADEHCGSPALWRSIHARFAGAVAVHRARVVPRCRFEQRLMKGEVMVHRNIAEWRGAELVDRDGDKIGKLEHVYADVETDEPIFGTVKEGLIGRHLTFVPLGGITIGPDNLQVPVSSEQGGRSPSEAERLRGARLSVWEYEGGGLGPLRPPSGQRSEVVFDGVTLLTAPGVVMTPRHTSEALVDWAVEWIGSRSVRVADVGTGSGAVAIAVALRAPGAQIWATDDSEHAVALARANVARFGLERRVRVFAGNLLEPLAGQLDLVLANLPYHAEARSRGAAASACRDQPEHAIYAPGDGLRFNRELIEACRTRLAASGALAIQLYGHVLAAGSGEIDQLLAEIEARAAEGWEARDSAQHLAVAARREPQQGTA